MEDPKLVKENWKWQKNDRHQNFGSPNFLESAKKNDLSLYSNSVIKGLNSVNHVSLENFSLEATMKKSLFSILESKFCWFKNRKFDSTRYSISFPPWTQAWSFPSESYSKGLHCKKNSSEIHSPPSSRKNLRYSDSKKCFQFWYTSTFIIYFHS